jgi:hypothetical protein
MRKSIAVLTLAVGLALPTSAPAADPIVRITMLPHSFVLFARADGVVPHRHRAFGWFGPAAARECPDGFRFHARRASTGHLVHVSYQRHVLYNRHEFRTSVDVRCK